MKILKNLKQNVLIKGGHSNSKILTDVFFNNSEVIFLEIKKLKLKILMALDVHFPALLQHFYHVENL